jgi:hypothetical protein
MITTLPEYISYKMTIGLKNITEQPHCNDYSKRGLSEPLQAMTEGEACLASFLLLELDVGAPSCCSSMATKGKLE